MPKTISRLLFACALCLTACGGTESGPAAAAEPQAAPATQVQPAPANPTSFLTGTQCSDKNWTDDFWSDATHTTLVGQLHCPCYGAQTMTGVTSDFITLAHEFDCSLQ
jgi:curli biogenesis system outer membrane secretion channel CsgG